MSIVKGTVTVEPTAEQLAEAFKPWTATGDEFYDKPERKSLMYEGRDSYTFFWKENEENGEFSNWYRRTFVIDDFEYMFVEQYMMAQKAKHFHDSKRYTQILRARTPWECKDLGKQVSPFDPVEWNLVKLLWLKQVQKTGYGE